MPKRIQMTRMKGGWRAANPDAIICARPTRWGNPFQYRTYSGLARVPAVNGDPWEREDRISADGTRHDMHHPGGRVTVHHVRYMTREEIVATFRRALVTPTAHLRLFDRKAREYLTDELARRELAGRDLACWCRPQDACHCDVLLEVANTPPF